MDIKWLTEKASSLRRRGHWTDLCCGAYISAVGCYRDEILDYKATLTQGGVTRPVFCCRVYISVIALTTPKS
jgi:hypothetical protein